MAEYPGPSGEDIASAIRVAKEWPDVFGKGRASAMIVDLVEGLAGPGGS